QSATARNPHCRRTPPDIRKPADDDVDPFRRRMGHQRDQSLSTVDYAGNGCLSERCRQVLRCIISISLKPTVEATWIASNLSAGISQSNETSSGSHRKQWSQCLGCATAEWRLAAECCGCSDTPQLDSFCMQHPPGVRMLRVLWASSSEVSSPS